jgi:hypothetical protein
VVWGETDGQFGVRRRQPGTSSVAPWLPNRNSALMGVIFPLVIP